MLFLTCIFPPRVQENMYCLISGSAPKCTSNTTETNEAVAGKYIKYSCEWKYKGNLTPKMKWMGQNSGEDIDATNETTVDMIKYSTVLKIKPSHNGEVFMCWTFFDKPQPQHHFAADNIPINLHAFTELYAFAELRVYCKYCTPI